MNDIVILGMGNELLRDDSIGLRIVRALAECLPPAVAGRVALVESCSEGVDVLYEIEGYRTAIVIDAVEAQSIEVCGDDMPAGTCLALSLEDLEGTHRGRFVTSHGLDLPTLIHLGRLLGYRLPEHCMIAGIVVKDCSVFTTTLSPEMELALPAIVLRVRDMVCEAATVAGESGGLRRIGTRPMKGFFPAQGKRKEFL